jgi:hypothetical protein
LKRPVQGRAVEDALIDRQSMETDLEKRRRLVWDIEKTLIEDGVRPVLFHPRGAVCNQPWVKGMTQMVNGIYNGSRFEDVWLDRQMAGDLGGFAAAANLAATFAIGRVSGCWGEAGASLQLPDLRR